MHTYCFIVKSSMDIAWQELEEAGVELLYSSETPDGIKEIFGNAKDDLVLPPSISKATKCSLNSIDWTAQWATHGLDFHDGFVHVGTLKLKPGPGFGDLSHPTTRLVLKMMEPYVANAHVLDVGCGSGILSLAAASWGALNVHGLDIDPEAIEHAKQNALLNNLEITFGFPEDYKAPASKLVVLMNMISSEQKLAVKVLENISGDLFISGILEEEFDEYLEETQRYGWQYKSHVNEEGWIGFHFIKNLSQYIV